MLFLSWRPRRHLPQILSRRLARREHARDHARRDVRLDGRTPRPQAGGPGRSRLSLYLRPRLSRRRRPRAARFSRQRASLCVRHRRPHAAALAEGAELFGRPEAFRGDAGLLGLVRALGKRSEEHTSELQSLMRISYAVFFLKKTNNILYVRLQVEEDI